MTGVDSLGLHLQRIRGNDQSRQGSMYVAHDSPDKGQFVGRALFLDPVKQNNDTVPGNGTVVKQTLQSDLKHIAPGRDAMLSAPPETKVLLTATLQAGEKSGEQLKTPSPEVVQMTAAPGAEPPDGGSGTVVVEQETAPAPQPSSSKAVHVAAPPDPGPPDGSDGAAAEKRVLPALPPLPKLLAPSDPAPAPAPAPVSVAAPGKAQSFEINYKKLAAPSRLSLSIALLASGVSPLPKALRDCISPSGVRSYLRAHIFNGIMSSGRGKHYGDINRACLEQEGYWGTIAAAARTDSLQLRPADRREFEGDFATIHDGMLKAISILKRMLELQKAERARAGGRKTVVARATSEHVLRTIRRQHDQLFGSGRSGSPFGPATKVSMALDDLLRLNVDRYLDLKDASALIAQLIVDQGTITKMATVLSEGSESTGRGFDKRLEAARVELKARQDSGITALRKAGFISLKHADHIIRALDYISAGLANPRHKLNRVLDPISGSASASDALMGIVASMAVGEEVKLDGGWSRGVKFDGLVARAPYMELNYIGSPFAIGTDQSYNYALTIRKEASGIKVIIGRSRAYGVDGGINSWYGFRIVDFAQKFIKKYNISLEVAASLGARYERGNEDQFNFTIPDGQDQLHHLRQLLTGKTGSLDTLLKIENLGKFGNSNKSKRNVNMVANAGVGPYASGTMFMGGTQLQGQSFPCPLAAAIELGLYVKSNEKGLSFDADAGTLSRTSKKKRSNLFTHRMVRFMFGMSSTTRGRVDFAEKDDLVAAPHYTMPVRLQGVYAMPSASWNGLLGGHAIPDCGDFSYRRGDDGKINKISWDLTLPSSGKIMEHPTILNLIKTLDSDDKKERTKAAIIEGASFTTRENREEIQALLNDIESRHPRLEAKIAELRKMSNFLSSSDRWWFRWQVRALVGGIDGAPERVLSRLSGMQAKGDLGRDITRLLALTEKYDDGRWPWREDMRTITFKADATEAMIAKVNESEDTEAAIKEEFSKEHNGRITGLTVGQSRTNSTALFLPLPVLLSGSSARLTLTRKSTWSVDKGAWDRPLSLSSAAGTATRSIGVPSQAAVNRPAIQRAAVEQAAAAPASGAPAAPAAPVGSVAPVGSTTPVATLAPARTPSLLENIGNAIWWLFRTLFEWLLYPFIGRRTAAGGHPA